MDNIVRIGHCIICNNFTKVKKLTCTKCKSVFGENCGYVVQHIMENPDFGKEFYNNIKTQEAKDNFISMLKGIMSLEDVQKIVD